MTNVFYRKCFKHNTTFLCKKESCSTCITEQRAHAVYIGADKEPHVWREIHTERDEEEKQVVSEQTEAFLMNEIRSSDEFHQHTFHLLEAITNRVKNTRNSRVKNMRNSKVLEDCRQIYINLGLFVSNNGKMFNTEVNSVRSALNQLFEEQFINTKPFIEVDTSKFTFYTSNIINTLQKDIEFNQKLKIALLTHHEHKMSARLRIEPVIKEWVETNGKRISLQTISVVARAFAGAWIYRNGSSQQ